ncbi:MAG TPA: hypothetical protein VFS29_04910 [Motilibacteraceae bacterium]|nr:hypothetical protein [Motilibacteraceae bacterium]
MAPARSHCRCPARLVARHVDGTMVDRAGAVAAAAAGAPLEEVTLAVVVDCRCAKRGSRASTSRQTAASTGSVSRSRTDPTVTASTDAGSARSAATIPGRAASSATSASRSSAGASRTSRASADSSPKRGRRAGTEPATVSPASAARQPSAGGSAATPSHSQPPSPTPGRLRSQRSTRRVR